MRTSVLLACSRYSSALWRDPGELRACRGWPIRHRQRRHHRSGGLFGSAMMGALGRRAR